MKIKQNILFYIAQLIHDRRPHSRDSFWDFNKDNKIEDITFTEGFYGDHAHGRSLIHKFIIRDDKIIYVRNNYLEYDSVDLNQPDCLEQIKIMVERALA